jgi:predicted RNA polymerase sigma factor
VSHRETGLRTLAPQVLGALTRQYGDFATAEDAVQEALAAAAATWPADGIPADPRGWLIRAAARRMTERGRREVAADAVSHADDTLILLGMCAHPTVGEHASIVLTLRAVGGLTTADIAGAFLVPENTMAQRISRAKQAIRTAGVPFALPAEAERAARLAGVLRVLYLIFSEGHVGGQGPLLVGADLAAEAIRLTRAVRRRLPEDPEVAGLLALMLLTDARRDARIGPDGELIPVADQDRSRWNRQAIAEGAALVGRGRAEGATGPYQLQAAIAALHGEAARAADTDWARILALYGRLEALTPNPMITLNRAIALAMVEGPAAGLALVAPLDTDAQLSGHYRLDAVRAQLHGMAGERDAARTHYLAAAAKTASIPERTYLQKRAAALGDPAAP